MFWTDWGIKAKLERSNTDGTGRLILVSTGIVWPNGLTLDYDEEMIYWVDANRDTIESCGLDGYERRVVVDKVRENQAISVVYPFSRCYAYFLSHYFSIFLPYGPVAMRGCYHDCD